MGNNGTIVIVVRAPERYKAHLECRVEPTTNPSPVSSHLPASTPSTLEKWHHQREPPKQVRFIVTPSYVFLEANDDDALAGTIATPAAGAKGAAKAPPAPAPVCVFRP